MTKNKKILFIFFICGLLAIFLPSFVLAQTKLTNPLGTSDLPTLIGRVISAVLGIVGSIALLMFIYGGFLWLTSAGNEKKITDGKNVLVWATIGLAIIFLSYTMVSFVIKGITTSSSSSTDGSQSQQPEIGNCVCTGGGGYTTQNTPDQCTVTMNPQYLPCSWSPR